MPEQHAGIKTFLIADVRGYTAFTHDRGDEAAARLATKFAELARSAIDAGGGSLIELRGDEALAVFDSARQAIRTATDLQVQFVAETVADPTLPLAVGIGLDAGEAVRVDGGYRGGALNLAARLCSLAGPGEVLASREVAHLARKVDGVKYVERGSVRMKGLADPIDVIRVRPELEDLTQDLAFRRALGPAAVLVAEGLEARNPYKGLRAFEEVDAADFFGREALTEHLLGRIAETRFLAVVGPSGSGKSSVVRAGLVPALRGGALPDSESWRIMEMFPGAYPLEELEAALLRVADNPPASLIEQLEDGERGLLRALKRILPTDDSELVLVLDQLEEVFTLVEDEGRRKHFLSIVERAVADPHSRLRVVTTLRADFYDRPLLYSGFAELLRDFVEALVPLTPDEFERAISGPAERVDVTLEPGLLSEMVADVANEPGALPLLQYALTELYERREGNVLTRDAYHAIGGVSGALAGRAEEIYAGLSNSAQDAARQLFLRLVTLGEGAEDTRRRVDRTELASMEVDQEAMTQAIDAFGDSRLLSFDRDPRTGTPTVEVAHEALLGEWTRLRRWIDSAREQVRLHRRLSAAASEWQDAARDQSFLLRGGNLAQFELLADESDIALTELEREFVDTSRTENELELARQQRQNRRLKTLLAGVGVLLALAVAAGIVALLQRQSAKHEATVALARQLGAQAVIEPRIDRALLLAHEGVNLSRSPQTEGTLLATLLRSPAAIGTLTMPIDVRPCCALAVSPDGRTLAVSDNANNVRFVDTATRRVERVLADFGATQGVAYTPDGSELDDWGGSGYPTVEVLNSKTFQVVRKLHASKQFLSASSDSPANPFLISRDGRTVFYVYGGQFTPDGGPGQAWVDRWNLATGRPLSPPSVPVGAPGARADALVDGGRELAVVGDDRVTFFDAATMRRLRSKPVAAAGAAAIDSTGNLLALGTHAGAVSFVDLRTGRITRARGGLSSGVAREVFSPDGKLVASSADDGTVIVWDPRTGDPVETLNGHAARPLGVAFGSDGQTLYTSSLDGAVFEWEVGSKRRFGIPYAAHMGPAPASLDAPLLPSLQLSGDGKRFAIRVASRRIGIFSTESGRQIRTLDLGGELFAFAWSPSGDEMAVAGANGRVEVWDVRAKPRLMKTLTGSLSSTTGLPEAVTTIAFSPDGRRVAAGDVNHTPGAAPRLGRVAIWDAASGRLLWKSPTLGDAVGALAFSPDGQTLAAGAVTSRLELIEPATGRVKRTLHLFGSGAVTALAFSRTGMLATGSDAGIVQLWNPVTGTEIGHPTLVAAAPVASIAFAPDGATFATAGGSDGLVKLWTTATQQQFGAAFPGDPPNWGSALFTPDGARLVVTYQDGRGFIWPTSLSAWEQHACAVAGRNLTREEWARFVGGRSYATVCSGFPSG